MEESSNNSVINSGFITIDAKPLYRVSKKPYHLEKRFNRNSLGLSHRYQQVESKRKALLDERRQTLNRKFLKVKMVAREVKAKRARKTDLLFKSMAMAEIKRDIYMQKRRESCGRTVERAKRIVTQNQRRSELKQRKQKIELEKRLAKSEERRLDHLKNLKKPSQKSEALNFQGNNQSDSRNSVEKPPSVSSETPKEKKPSNWSILLSAFKELGMPSPSHPETWLEFNALGNLLHEAKVIVVTTKILNTALKLVDDKSRHRGRILLTSYMILMCPTEILQDVNSTEEKILYNSAKRMLQLFEMWLSAHGRPGATAARLAFVDAWDEYHIIFEKWKSRDRENLIQNMVTYYVELSTLRQNLTKNEDKVVDQQLELQLKQVTTKLEKLGGLGALETVKESIKPSNQESSSKEKSSDSTPDLGHVSQMFKDFQAPGLTNQQLAHELIMDPEFQLKRHEPQSQLEKQVKEMAEKAYFDRIAEDIRNGSSDASLLLLIKDVRTRLLTIVHHGTPMYQNIDEAMDLDHIEQQMKQKSFDMQKMLHYVLDTASNMCAPVRDHAVQEARNTHDMIEQAKKILDLIENMSLDLANFRLRSLRPHLMSIAVEYERETFKLPVVRTQAWLDRSAAKLCQLAAQRNPENVQPEKNNRPSSEAVFEDALLSLLSQNQLIVYDEDVPETFVLDTKRLAEFQNEVQAITIVASLLMLTRNFGGKAQALSVLSSKLFTMLEDKTTNIDNLSMEISRTINASTERTEMIRSMVDKTVSHHDTIYSLLLRRVITIIKSTIQHKKFVTDAVIHSNGLEHVRSNLHSLSIRIQRLVHHNKKVYSTWYDKIITEALDKHIVVSPLSQSTNKH